MAFLLELNYCTLDLYTAHKSTTLEKVLKCSLGVIQSPKGRVYLDSLVQDCSNSSANALELLQSDNKPSIYGQARSQPMKDDITYVTAPLISKHLA